MLSLLNCNAEGAGIIQIKINVKWRYFLSGFGLPTLFKATIVVVCKGGGRCDCPIIGVQVVSGCTCNVNGGRCEHYNEWKDVKFCTGVPFV